jgi:hypothetical protein
MGRLRVVWIINLELKGGSPICFDYGPHQLGLNEQAFKMY